MWIPLGPLADQIVRQHAETTVFAECGFGLSQAGEHPFEVKVIRIGQTDAGGAASGVKTDFAYFR